MNLWYLSFCDIDRPKGSQFSGACIVFGKNIIEAVQNAHRHGCNPGGEVVGCQLNKQPQNKFLNRLMQKSELDNISFE